MFSISFNDVQMLMSTVGVWVGEVNGNALNMKLPSLRKIARSHSDGALKPAKYTQKLDNIDEFDSINQHHEATLLQDQQFTPKVCHTCFFVVCIN